jgi:ASC-1-like (ASCH) protein
MLHEYKVHPQFFEALESGRKPFDVRKHDPRRRALVDGDMVWFREHDGQRYSGRELHKLVTYVLDGDDRYLPRGWFVMGLDDV